MYLSRNMKEVLLWALWRAYRHDSEEGTFTTSYKEACDENRMHRNTLTGIFKKLRVLDAFEWFENDDTTFTINMSDHKQLTMVIMPFFESILNLRGKRLKNARILYNNGKNLDKLKLVNPIAKEAISEIETSQSITKKPLSELSQITEIEASKKSSKKASSAKKRRTNTKSRTKVPDYRVVVAEEVLGRLSELAGRSYKHTNKQNLKLIKELLAQGYTREDMLKVVEFKCDEWQDTRFSEYVRPSTFFGHNFEHYLHMAHESERDSSDRRRGLWL